MTDVEQPLFERVDGVDFFVRLVDRFYDGVQADPLLLPLYPPDDMDGAKERLALFLVQFWGGPTTYSDERGHPRLRMRHAPFAIDPAARARWLQLMNRALDEAALPADADALLREFFAAVATMMINRPG